MHATSRSRHGRREPVPGLRRVLFVLVELATVHDRGRRRARPDPGQIRQRKIVGHALRRRSMLGAVRQGRRCDIMRDLCGAAGGLPHLHARRSRMRYGAAPARVATFQNNLNATASGTLFQTEPGSADLERFANDIGSVYMRTKMNGQLDGWAAAAGRDRRRGVGRLVLGLKSGRDRVRR